MRIGSSISCEPGQPLRKAEIPGARSGMRGAFAVMLRALMRGERARGATGGDVGLGNYAA